MSETKTRKAVVTTAEVQEGLSLYLATREAISGAKAEKQEFDKGARGKGFATYDASGAVVKTWETKEEALSFYAGWVEVAKDVLAMQQTRKPEAAKVAEGSQEGDSKAAA